jgi:hypothetical protein
MLHALGNLASALEGRPTAKPPREDEDAHYSRDLTTGARVRVDADHFGGSASPSFAPPRPSTHPAEGLCPILDEGTNRGAE